MAIVETPTLEESYEAELDNRSLKANLLLDASEKQPHVYYQFDGFLNAQPDCVSRPDEDGDDMFSCITPELRSGCIDVRIQILAGTSKKDAVRIAKKLVRCMKHADWKGWKQEATKFASGPNEQDKMPF